jgi:hypothetical protein
MNERNMPLDASTRSAIVRRFCALSATRRVNPSGLDGGDEPRRSLIFAC